MKSLIITLLFALLLMCSYNSKAQEYEYVPFPDSGAIWSEIYYPPWDDTVGPSLERFALSGEDTIINSLKYKKLYLFYDTVFNINNTTYFGGIRESMKRVYFKGDTILHEFKPVSYWFYVEELLLYDFSKDVGDTIYFGNPPTNYYENVIENIDTIQIDNTLRKVYHFKNYSWVEWIEGIGNTMGLLFASGDLPSNGMGGNLICFKQNDEILYFNNTYNECMPLISSIPINNHESNQIKLFPNPSNQYINISFPHNVSGLLLIYTTDGKKMLETNVINTKEFEINLSGINKGLYLLVFKNKDNKIFYNKLIIN